MATVTAFVDLRIYQPWPAGKVVDLAGVRIEPVAAQPYALVARVEVDDGPDEQCVVRARSAVGVALRLIRLAFTQQIDLDGGVRLERAGQSGGVGYKDVPAKACVRRPGPLLASDFTALDHATAAYASLGSGKRLRMRSAAFWFERARQAPDKVSEFAALWIGIEAVGGSTGSSIASTIAKNVLKLDPTVAGGSEFLLTAKIEELHQSRSRVFHYGRLDEHLPSVDNDLARARDLLAFLVTRTLGLPYAGSHEFAK